MIKITRSLSLQKKLQEIY